VRLVVILFLSILTSLKGFSQTVLFCDKNQLIWCGVDFSLARFMGTFSVAGNKGKLLPQELKGYFEIWNNRILNEAEKINYRSLGFAHTAQNTQITKKKNDAVDSSRMIIFEYYTLKEQQLDSLIKTYDIPSGQTGLGLTFIVEYLDKVHTQASLYAVFFNLETKQMVFKQKVQTEPVGIGQSNYWFNAFLKTFTWIVEKGNKEWEKKYCKK
jgi:hypothetical protein